MDGCSAAFANAAPSIHPFDLLSTAVRFKNGVCGTFVKEEKAEFVKLKLDTHDQNLGFFQETGRLDAVMYVLERLAFLHRMRQPSEFSSRHHFAQREIAPDVFFFGCVFQPRPQQPVNHDHGIPRRTLIGERTLGNVSIQCARISFVVVIRTRIRGTSVECDHNPP